MAKQLPGHRSARQTIDLTKDLLQTSWGYAVPFVDYVEERPTMQTSVDDKSNTDLRTYWTDRNTHTIDGQQTGDQFQ